MYLLRTCIEYIFLLEYKWNLSCHFVSWVGDVHLSVNHAGVEVLPSTDATLSGRENDWMLPPTQVTLLSLYRGANHEMFYFAILRQNHMVPQTNKTRLLAT
ncbi:hypothetical protein VPH35_055661 [Triticum aestivum]